MSNLNKYLIIGSTGVVGHYVVDWMVSKNCEVIAACRDIKKCKFIGKNITPIIFDYSDKSTWDNALLGVKAVFLIALPLDPNPERDMAPFILKCKEKGIQKLVFLSALNADKLPILKIEKLIINSGITYSIVRPPLFMDNFSQGFLKDQVEKGIVEAPLAGHHVAFISCKDIAECISVLLTTNKFDNQIIDITGPKSYSFEDITKIITYSTGKEVKFINAKSDSFYKGLESYGMPHESIKYLNDLYDLVNQDKSNKIFDGVKKITGHDPITFEQFARDNFRANVLPSM